MGHQVREIVLQIVVSERDGAIPDVINALIRDEAGEQPDWLLSVITLRDKQRDASPDEIETLWELGGCPTCGANADTFIDGDCRDCNPPVAKGVSP